MWAEYALEPELLNNWRDFRFFVDQFGSAKGRLIARYPKKWKALVIRAAQETAADLEYMKIEESLRNIDTIVLPRTHEWDRQQAWLPNALMEHGKRPFRGILSRSNADESFVLCGDDLDPMNPPDIWVVRRSIQIPRTAADMASCIAPLLRHCKRVMFVDPHYDPANRRHRLPLQSFLAEIVGRDAQIPMPTIEYHTSNKNRDVATFQNGLSRWVAPSLPASARMVVVRWKPAELHNRYVLTDRGGVMFGTGLDQDDTVPPSEDTVTLLDDESCAELMVAYSSSSTQFTWLDDKLEIQGLPIDEKPE